MKTKTHSNDSEGLQPGKYSNRSRARLVAFQILYQEDLNPGSITMFSDEYIKDELPDNKLLIEFTQSLISNTRAKCNEIDEQIGKLSRNWSVSRMNATDRNILRLAVSEMNNWDTPKPVVIKEALELARQFGTKDSPAFVNGILDQYVPVK